MNKNIKNKKLLKLNDIDRKTLMTYSDSMVEHPVTLPKTITPKKNILKV